MYTSALFWVGAISFLVGCKSHVIQPSPLIFEQFALESADAEDFDGMLLPRATPDELSDRGLEALHSASGTADFAGWYRIVTWGCGSPCQMHVILNVETREIVAILSTSLGLEYRVDSRLLIADPSEAIRAAYASPVSALVSRTRGYVIRADGLFEIGTWLAW